jgi:bacillithiol biosynthesis deacetylase BshB1
MRSASPILTRGELGTRGDVNVRAAEARAAAEVLGAKVRIGLGLPDGGLDRRDPAQLRAVVECLRTHRPGLVVAPDRHDEHPDHVEASALVARACYLAGLARYDAPGERFRPARLLFALYRSGTAPHVVVDVSEVWPRRMQALRGARASSIPTAGPATHLTGHGFLESVEARARAWGRSRA